MNDRKLAYYLPKANKPHTILKIPESHTLYAGPLSCTRRHAVNAVKYGDRGDVSFLFITEADVISGTYEDLIAESIEKLLECLVPQPKVFMIAVFCIDDFLGTDEEALVRRLEEMYPGRQFGFQHIDPVSLDEKISMDFKKNGSLYSFIRPQKTKDNGVNFIGNFESLHPECEFLSYLKEWGADPVRQIFDCKTYEEYQDMGKSRLNVILRFMGSSGAKWFQEELGIPSCRFTTSYDPEKVAAGYSEIAALLGAESRDFSAEAAGVKEEMRRTAEYIKGTAVAVDSSASIVTFDMAAALLKAGFNVKYVFRSSHFFKVNPEEEEYVRSCGGVNVTAASDYKNLLNPDEKTECIAIGTDACRVLRAAHFVDMWHDEGYFGFHGIRRLMADIRNAYDTEKGGR